MNAIVSKAELGFLPSIFHTVWRQKNAFVDPVLPIESGRRLGPTARFNGSDIPASVFFCELQLRDRSGL